MAETLVVALGGNALQRSGLPADAQNQLRTVRETAARLVEIMGLAPRMAVAHGNGPQVGRLALQNEAGAGLTPPMPFDVLGAMSQGMIGYHIQQALGDAMGKAGLERGAAALVTQVVVSPDDPAFSNPTKPIGPFYDREAAEALRRGKGFSFREDAGRGWRRVVASPMPLEIVEIGQVKALLGAGFVPVTVGGGGIPVVREADGTLRGVEAVIDKDLAAWRLAEALEADTLLILTEVEQAYLRYGTPQQKALRSVTPEELEGFMREGHFAPGSMGPKAEAALRFTKGRPGRRAVITRLDLAPEGLDGSRGTQVTA
ncbi:MAG TPA: carbamate kinase [Candidatus Limnocylindria bacterium]|nr:carbamate kinase [Candidatus Limnocylindria bacterium]